MKIIKTSPDIAIGIRLRKKSSAADDAASADLVAEAVRCIPSIASFDLLECHDGRIVVQVVDGDLNPVSNVNVRMFAALYGADWWNGTSANVDVIGLTDSDGRATLDYDPPGLPYLAAFHIIRDDGTAERLQTIYIPPPPVHNRMAFAEVATENTTLGTSRGLYVFGKLTLPDGSAPGAGGSVTIAYPGKPSQTTNLYTDGRFVIDFWDYDLFTLTATHPTHGTVTIASKATICPDAHPPQDNV